MHQDLESVHFTDLLEHNVDSCASFSPNGSMLACVSDSQVLVWSVDMRDIVHKFVCDHPIDSFAWSPNSELIYCTMTKQSSVQVWSVVATSWRCKIEENPLSIADVLWSPDSQHLLIVSEFHLKITVWSLVSRSITLIESPKAVRDCLGFSGCSKYMAVAEKKKSEDCVGIYTCDTWEVLKCFPVDTNDVAGIYFAPSELTIGILETPVEKNRILFYCVDGRLLGTYSNHCSSLFSWSPSGKFLAASDNEGGVAIISAFNYEKIISYQLSETIDSEDVVIYRIIQKSSKISSSINCGTSNWELFEVVKERPVSLSSISSSLEKGKSKFHTLQYSRDGQFIALVNVTMPNMIFIFDTSKLKLSDVIVCHRKIRTVSWHPVKPLLAVCCGSGSFHLWTPNSCVTCVVPFKGDFAITSATWCPTKQCVILNSKTHSSVLYFPES